MQEGNRPNYACGGGMLRRELNARAHDFAIRRGLLYALSDGASPTVVFGCDDSGRHGNFHPSSFRRIRENPEYRHRLMKVHNLSRRMHVRADWRWMELDCAHSSDALLMNVFCYPRIFTEGAFAALLGVSRKDEPRFGVPMHVPLTDGTADRSEADMRIGDLIVESKLTESNLQSASWKTLVKYRSMEIVFNITDLPRRQDRYEGYQVIRGVLAAVARDGAYCLICDERRRDLIECFHKVTRAVVATEMRWRARLLTWQEIASYAPQALRLFLADKYGF